MITLHNIEDFLALLSQEKEQEVLALIKEFDLAIV